MEFTGKTVEEAIEKGLQELGLTADEAEIQVLEEGKKKLFGSVKAKVEIVAKKVEEPIKTENGAEGQRTVEFLDGLFRVLNIKACAELVSEDEKISINVTAANSTAVIGKHGAMLDAIQTLAGAVANIGRDDYLRVSVDCENYRNKRENTLVKLADNLSEKAIRLGKKIALEPMNPYERRIMHAALSEKEGVKTKSEGKEPNRYLVIIPDNLEDPTAPALPARTERDRRDNRGGNRGRGGRGGNGKGGSRGGFNKKPFDRKPRSSGGASTGGTSLKNTDFFGIFLGNSGNNGEE